ncbi:MAG: hypothetical protein V4585_01220 [Bacteroidota bacterium]
MSRLSLTEKQLESLSDEMKYEKLNYYLALLNESSHENLSFEEKSWVYKNIIGNVIYFSYLHINPWIEYLHYLDNKYLEDAKFYYLFLLCDYCNDLEGICVHRHPILQAVIPESLNQINVKFLNEVNNLWHKNFECHNSSELLKEAKRECKKMKTEEKKEFKKQRLEINIWKIKEKQLNLFYKYIYLKGLVIFNDKTEFILSLLGQNIIFDFESYFHIHRHFAQSLKPDLLNKSYFGQDFLPDNIVQILSDIFLKISESGSEIILLDEDFGICFELNQVVYQLWIKKNKIENTFRISSLYPVERTSVANDFRELHRIKLADNLYYFSKDKIILP